MRNGSFGITLGLVISGLAAYVGCGDDDPASSTPSDHDGGPPSLSEAGPEAPPPGLDGGPDADAADEDAGPKETAQIVGYVFSNQPNADESTPSAAFSYNATGGAMKVTHTEEGRYTVTFAGLPSNSVAIVSAYDTAGGLCHWAGTTGEEVNVRCLNAAGGVQNAKFVLTVFAKGTTGATILGFAHANDKANASYTPEAKRSNNTGGGPITASRTSVGTYQVEFDGIEGDDIENVQVVPYADEDARCVVKSWGGSKVNVQCYDTAGALADAEYLVMLAGKKPGGTARVVAYAHANESKSDIYAPALAYNEGGGSVTATRASTGTYSIAFAGHDFDNGAHVQVTGQGQGRRCNVSGWAGGTLGLTCITAGGSKQDNNYAIVVLQ